MLYFDTDVIVHYIIFQDKVKQKLAQEIIKQAIKTSTFFASILTYQELAFVLAKLKLNNSNILRNLSFFMQFNKAVYKSRTDQSY